MFTSSDDECPVRSQHSSTAANGPAHRSADLSSSEHHNQHHYHISTQTTDQFYTNFDNVAWDEDTTSTEGDFPTGPLDDDIWAEDPIWDRQLCIQETPHKPNHQCSYPCPYSTTTFRMDLPQSTPQDEAVLNYELMDFSDISSDLPDIIMIMSDNDIPDLVEFYECLDNMQCGIWFA